MNIKKKKFGLEKRFQFLLGLLGGAEVLIHSYGFLLRGEPGDTCPTVAFREGGSSEEGCPEKSGGLKPSEGPVTEEAPGGPPAV